MRAGTGRAAGAWDGDALVIETADIVTGDSATTGSPAGRRSPLPDRTFATLPMSPAAHTLERLTMTGPDTIAYELTYTDPEVFTASWTAAFEWTRDDSYRMYEYACHEGNEHVRTLIGTWRSRRGE